MSNMRSITKFSIATGEIKHLFGPLIISQGDMLNRVSKETDFRYSQRVFTEGYPHAPGVDIENVHLLKPLQLAILHQSLLSAINPERNGAAFEVFKQNLIREARGSKLALVWMPQTWSSEPIKRQHRRPRGRRRYN